MPADKYPVFLVGPVVHGLIMFALELDIVGGCGERDFEKALHISPNKPDEDPADPCKTVAVKSALVTMDEEDVPAAQVLMQLQNDGLIDRDPFE